VLLDGKRILITGGTGSLGRKVVHRLLGGSLGTPQSITVFSRDEAKQHYMRVEYHRRHALTDDIIYQNSRDLLRFIIGDMRDYWSVLQAVRGADVVIHGAALKQVPSCEYFPDQAVATNVLGAENLVRAVRESGSTIETVIGVSTDKACKPINVMGMTKALMERILIEANIRARGTRFACVRYGNVIASRGSVVPLFQEQIANGGPVTITLKEMTRFLLSLDRAVDTVVAAIAGARAGEIYVPIVPAARVVDLAQALINGQRIELKFTGIRPGEKIHETLVSDEEAYRTTRRGDYYVVLPMLPELQPETLTTTALSGEYSSEQVTLDTAGLREMLRTQDEADVQA
jgi:FlaA1/EpsC-like NDP-sugar epimerase